MSLGKSILYGRDNEENIVKIETLPHKNLVQIFKRENGELSSRYEDFKLFAFCNKAEKIKGKPLLGSNYYNKLVEFENYSDYNHFRRNYKDTNVPFLQSQYKLKSGKTVFKGMDFNDPLILFIDIEVITTPGYHFPISSRDGDEVIIIAMRTNRGDEILIYQGIKPEIGKDVNGVKHFSVGQNERYVLEEFLHQFRAIDPDIVVNHNIFNFDLPYLHDRFQKYGLNFALGRDGSEPNVYDTTIKFGDRKRDYKNYAIYGRDVIDTQFLAEYADVVLRSMPNYKLKDLVKFLGKESDARTYIEGRDITEYWFDEEKRPELIKYAIEDVREAEIVYNEYGQSIFILTQMVPMNYQEVFRYGTGNQIEYVFNREYLYQGYSLPKADPQQNIVGGYADVLEFGLIKGSIIYADVKSLYPSLAKMLKIQPKKDELKIYPIILDTLTNLRYEIKALIKEYIKTDQKSKIAQQKATDGSVKIMLNTMSYGFLAFSLSGFNDYGEAERITKNGQKIVKTMIDIIRKDGGFPIKVDTDGVALRVPKDWIGREEEYCDVRLTNELPEDIIIECDGKYKGIISFDRKSYALLQEDGKIKLKGNTITGRGVEKFVHTLVDQTIQYLFDKTDIEPNEIYKDLWNKIKHSNLEPHEIEKRASLNMSLNEYQMKRDAGETNIIAQYELAIKSPMLYNKGDVIYYYIKEYPYEFLLYRNKPTLKKKKCKVYEAAELIENYDYDIEPSFYYERLDKAVKKFMVLGKEQFETLFNVEVKKSDITRIEQITKKTYG